MPEYVERTLKESCYCNYSAKLKENVFSDMVKSSWGKQADGKIPKG
ncbi:MAG: hypothetical protein U0586_09225 [Candidatus Brocadiaceae bacterium]